MNLVQLIVCFQLKLYIFVSLSLLRLLTHSRKSTFSNICIVVVDLMLLHSSLIRLFEQLLDKSIASTLRADTLKYHSFHPSIMRRIMLILLEKFHDILFCGRRCSTYHRGLTRPRFLHFWHLSIRSSHIISWVICLDFVIIGTSLRKLHGTLMINLRQLTFFLCFLLARK